jgi:hypothetical protein
MMSPATPAAWLTGFIPDRCDQRLDVAVDAMPSGAASAVFCTSVFHIAAKPVAALP